MKELGLKDDLGDTHWETPDDLVPKHNGTDFLLKVSSRIYLDISQ